MCAFISGIVLFWCPFKKPSIWYNIPTEKGMAVYGSVCTHTSHHHPNPNTVLPRHWNTPPVPSQSLLRLWGPNNHTLDILSLLFLTFQHLNELLPLSTLLCLASFAHHCVYDSSMLLHVASLFSFPSVPLYAILYSIVEESSTCV